MCASCKTKNRRNDWDIFTLCAAQDQKPKKRLRHPKFWLRAKPKTEETLGTSTKNPSPQAKTSRKPIKPNTNQRNCDRVPKKPKKPMFQNHGGGGHGSETLVFLVFLVPYRSFFGLCLVLLVFSRFLLGGLFFWWMSRAFLRFLLAPGAETADVPRISLVFGQTVRMSHAFPLFLMTLAFLRPVNGESACQHQNRTTVTQFGSVLCQPPRTPRGDVLQASKASAQRTRLAVSPPRQGPRKGRTRQSPPRVPVCREADAPPHLPGSWRCAA